MRFPMTPTGEKQLRDELTELVTVQRPGVIAAIAEAREHGDLKENAEYHAARERQGFIEGRIKDLEGKLANAQVIDVTQIENTNKVIFGTTVTLRDSEKDSVVHYKIVGEEEADIKQSKLSVTSPLARAMIGKTVGEEIEVSTPNGFLYYDIEKVEHI